MHRSRVVLFAAVTAAALATSCGGHAMSHAKSASPMIRGTAAAAVTADPVAPDSRVGAIFVGGNSLHSCTGSVLHSATGDLVLTAAHCMADGADNWFVPAFSGSAAPQDFWHIDQIYLDPRWIADQDPLADFAVVSVSHPGHESLETAAGGGFTLGSTPAVGTDVAVTGYATGVGGGPIGCAGQMAARERGYPSLRCGGLVDGTSGAPWLTGDTVVGVTGGLQGGGCQENVSYAPPFDLAITALVARAEAGGSGDRVPPSYVDGC